MNRKSLRLVVPFLHVLFLLTAFRAFLVGQTSHQASPHLPQEYTFAIVAAYPHDTNAFTQGLAYRDGFLYEGTSREGKSSLRKVRLETGEIVQQVNLEPDLFGEGITLLKDKVIQLTWKSEIGFVYDLNNFHLLRRFSYSGEGWGLATDGRELFLSDGTPEIRVLDGETFQEKRRLKVHDGLTPIDQLNELEFVEGQIFANVSAQPPGCPDFPANRQCRRLDRPHRASGPHVSSRTAKPCSTASPTIRFANACS